MYYALYVAAEVRHMEPDMKKEKVLGQVVRYTKIQYLTCGGYIALLS